MKKSKNETPEEKSFIFINKAVFFPEQGILAIGDLHLGYESMLQESGINIPESQTEDIIKNLAEIFGKINEEGYKIKKIIFLGDIKHYFGFSYKEKNAFKKVLEFLRQKIPDKDIILIKGNHDKFDYSGKKMKNYYVKNRIAFLHGHIEFPKLWGRLEKIDTIVTGHLHPSIILSDKSNIKREKFKCFLVGKYKDKKMIILPSFLNINEGTSINEYAKNYDKNFSIIPRDKLLNFEIHVIGEEGIYDFGKIRDLDNN